MGKRLKRDARLRDERLHALQARLQAVFAVQLLTAAGVFVIIGYLLGRASARREDSEGSDRPPAPLGAER
jgi:hypothetical protein